MAVVHITNETFEKEVMQAGTSGLLGILVRTLPYAGTGY